jgi:DNA primase
MNKQEIKDRIRIENLIGETVKLSKSSRDMLSGLCPFHEDKNPSLRVYVETNSFTCFGCNVAGDIFSWVMKKENCDFKEACRILEDRIKAGKGNGGAGSGEKKPILDEVADYYHKSLPGEVFKYLTGERKLSEKTINIMKIGYADGGLYEHLKNKGYTKDEMLKYSLINENETDYFRKCIIFPNWEGGRVRYLSGRGYPEKRPVKPKGLKTPLFMPDALNKNPIIIAEGEIDTLTLLQRGYNATGLLGAKCFRPEWETGFRGKETFISLDPDEEGKAQAERIAGILPGSRIVTLPEGKDVNDFFKSFDNKAYDELLKTAKPLENTRKSHNRGESAKISLLDAPGRAEGCLDDVSLNRVKEIVKKWLYFDTYDIVDIVLGCAVINRKPIDPVWVFLVDPPSSGKTEILRGFQDPKFVYTLSKLTPKTLLSGKTNIKNYKTLKDPSLCSKLDSKIFIVKDFTTVLSLPHKEQNEIFSVLRDMHDGYTEIKTGENAEKFSYWLHAGFMAGVTLEIDRSHLIQGILGERFLKYRPESDRKKAILQARKNRGSEKLMREEINRAFDSFLNKEFDLSPVTWGEDQEEFIEGIADIITMIRTPVARDWRNFDVIEVLPQAEMPMRFCNSLKNLADGIAIVKGERAITKETLRPVVKIAFDCLPQKLCRLFKLLVAMKDYIPHVELGEQAKLNSDTVTRVMDDWNALGVVSIDKDTRPYKSVLKDEIRAKIEPFKGDLFSLGL